MSAGQARKNWFQTAFSQDYMRIYQHRDAAEAAAGIRSLLNRIDIPREQPCLDLCCGFGRHLELLLESGYDAYGLDLSLDLLQAADAGVQPRMLQGDMRHLPFRDEVFGYVLSFFTSFGYFPEDSQNAEVIQEIARVLQPGGGVLLDFLNASAVREKLVPEDVKEFPEFTVRQRRWIDSENNSVDKELTVIEDGEERRYRESVKLYGPDDFQYFFAAAGLQLTQMLGSPAGEPFEAESADRLILIGAKA